MTRTRWPRAKLADHVDLVSGFPFKSAGFTGDLQDVPLVKGENVHQGYIDWDKAKRWPRDQIEGLEKYWLKPGDVILAMDRPWIEAGLKQACIQSHDPPSLLVQRVSRLRGVNGLSTAYLRQLIASPSFTDYIKPIVTGINVPHISGTQIKGFEFLLPPQPAQERIASILAAYDGLIENNIRRITILEEMARRIYEEWFVRFRFPGHTGVQMVGSDLGLVPEGWAALKFEELLDSWRGGDWGSDEMSGADTAPVFVIRGTDFDDLAHGTGNRVPARFIEPKSLEKRKLRPFDVVVENSINAKSRSAGKTLLITPGLLKRLGGDAIAASFCKVFRFRDPNLAPLAHLKMRQLFEAGDMAFFQNVAANGIANFQATRFVSTQFISLPIDELRRRRILDMFSAFTRSTHADAISNLRTTRDLLLPKLVSGELDVSAMPEPEALAA